MIFIELGQVLLCCLYNPSLKNHHRAKSLLLSLQLIFFWESCLIRKGRSHILSPWESGVFAITIWVWPWDRHFCVLLQYESIAKYCIFWFNLVMVPLLPSLIKDYNDGYVFCIFVRSNDFLIDFYGKCFNLFFYLFKIWIYIWCFGVNFCVFVFVSIYF